MRKTDPRRMKFRNPPVRPRRPVRVKLPNGVPLHFLRDANLPVVSFGAMFRAGAIYDPDSRLGTGSITAATMRLGGSAFQKPDALDEELDRLGARLEIGLDDDSLWFEAWCLKRHLRRMIRMVSDVIRYPAFPAGKIELARSRELEVIRRRWDQPATAANLMFRKMVYGENTVWGRLGGEREVKAVGRRDLTAYHARLIARGDMLLAAAGDFSQGEIVSLMKDGFGRWARPPRDSSAIPPLRVSFPGGVYLIPRAVGQANFRIGHLGVKIQHPDHCPLKLMDMILGGGAFSSRLFKDIRTERGLAYAIWSRMAPRSMEVGTFHVGGETKYASVGEAVGAVLRHLKALQEKKVGLHEIRLAKETLANGYPFEFQSSWDTVWRQVEYEYNGMPSDWLAAERKGLLAVTPEAIRRAAKAHLHPESPLILVVGDPDRCRRRLRRFGPVRELPVPA